MTEKKNVNEWSEQDYENFVREHSILFHAFVRQYLKDKSLGQDIVQDALFNLWQNKKRMQHVTDAKNYLFVMIKNRAFNYLKREKKITCLEDIPLDKYDDTDFMNDMISAETFSALVAEIKMLDLESQKIIEMAMNGKRNEEIANELGLSIDGVKSKKKRILLKLKKKFGAEMLLILLYFHG